MSENRKLLEMNVPMWFDGKSINEALFLSLIHISEPTRRS